MFMKKEDPQWDKGIAHLRGYRKMNGDAEIPLMYRTPNGFPLGHWLHGQKRLGRRLDPKRQEQLKSCGVVIS